MAKMINCPLCGKEIKKGIFSGDDVLLTVGDTYISCCQDCHDKYAAYKLDQKRFAAKICNYQMLTKQKKLTDVQLARLYATYVRESADHVKSGSEDVEYGILAGAIKVTADGRFSVMEFANDFLHIEPDVKEMFRSAKKAAADKEIWFTKDDITKIEYFSNRSGSFNGSMEKVYSYSVRFNDESQITFRPTITHAIVAGKGIMFGYREKAEEQLVTQLKAFRAMIGSDLPVVRVKN